MRPGGPFPFDLWVATRTDSVSAWQNVQLVPVVNSLSSDWDPSISTDKLNLYLHSSRSGGTDLWVSARASVTSTWGNPVLVGGVNGVDSDCCPSVSADDLALYFSSNRASPSEGFDLWMATRPSPGDAWGAPMLVPGASLNTSDQEKGPSISGDNCTIYFASNRGVAPGILQIWAAHRTP